MPRPNTIDTEWKCTDYVQPPWSLTSNKTSKYCHPTNLFIQEETICQLLHYIEHN